MEKTGAGRELTGLADQEEAGKGRELFYTRHSRVVAICFCSPLSTQLPSCVGAASWNWSTIGEIGKSVILRRSLALLCVIVGGPTLSWWGFYSRIWVLFAYPSRLYILPVLYKKKDN